MFSNFRKILFIKSVFLIIMSKIGIGDSSKSTLDPRDENHKSRIESIRRSCGEVCDTSISGIPGKYYDEIMKDIDCRSIFSNPDLDLAGEFTQPPKEIPDYLLNEFTYNGRLKVVSSYRDDTVKTDFQTDWSSHKLEDYQKIYQESTANESDGHPLFAEISKFLNNHIVVKGKRVLVIGSVDPWIEVILLEKGAKFVTTVDYSKINCSHPKIETLTPDEISERYLKEKIQFDVMVSFSSIEHSGLGRYGDMLNPWGDLIAMAKAWCLVKPGGKALVGVPSGPDMIMFNSHRLYGPISYAQLFANWIVDYTNNDFAEFNKTGCDYCYHPLHVLHKMY